MSADTARTAPTPERVDAMRDEVSTLAAEHAEHESKATRNARNEAMARWHAELGEGHLSAIARAAGLSRIQAGRIVKAERERVPGADPLPSHRFYQ